GRVAAKASRVFVVTSLLQCRHRPRVVGGLPLCNGRLMTETAGGGAAVGPALEDLRLLLALLLVLGHQKFLLGNASAFGIDPGEQTNPQLLANRCIEGQRVVFERRQTAILAGSQVDAADVRPSGAREHDSRFAYQGRAARLATGAM